MFDFKPYFFIFVSKLNQKEQFKFEELSSNLTEVLYDLSLFDSELLIKNWSCILERDQGFSSLLFRNKTKNRSLKLCLILSLIFLFLFSKLNQKEQFKFEELSSNLTEVLYDLSLFDSELLIKNWSCILERDQGFSSLLFRNKTKNRSLKLCLILSLIFLFLFRN